MNPSVNPPNAPWDPSKWVASPLQEKYTSLFNKNQNIKCCDDQDCDKNCDLKKKNLDYVTRNSVYKNLDKNNKKDNPECIIS